MNERQPSEFSEAVLQGLKAFQRRTVEHAFSRLYEATDSTRRFLVADEAGLGKTLVAAGVIAKAIDHLSNEDIGRIDVIYICSNQAIARQNVERIKQRLGIDAKALAERVTLLPYRLTTLNQRINLIALTPGTSFNSASAEGVAEERIILFRMLTRIWGDLGHGGRLVFKGGLADVPRFRQYESWYRDREVDAGIRRRFRCAVGEVDSQLYHEFIQVRNSLVIGEDHQSLRRRRRFVGKLRGILANACLDSLEPDFVILDEFQRFRDLMDTRTESGELAQRLFEYEDSHTQVRTLLLSATPYKMYTLSHETEDDHYRDFLRTLSFLEGPGKSSERLEELLREFRMDMSRIALQGDIGDDVSGRLIAIQAQIQSTLQRVMSRTERRGSDVVGDPMLSVRDLKVDLRPDEVEAYLEAKEIAAAVNAPGVMEYWKSAPYLLSFMEQYKLPQRILDAGAGESKGTVAQLIRKGAHLQLERSRIDVRRKVDGGNGRMRAFLSDLNTSGLQKLLWLPPAMPSYKLGKDFSEALAATKRLVFSSWTMVPRAVAVMASYDAEHQYIRDAARDARYSAQLLSVTASSYSVFALLAPSSTLAEYGDPFRHSDGSTYELLRSIEERLRPRIEEITRGAPREGDPQEVWYAVAPLL